MAQSVGNLAIIISGNAAPFRNALQGVNNDIRQFSTQIGTQNIFRQSASSPFGIQFGSWGRLIRSSMVSAFGGGFAGALVGVGAMAFGELLSKSLGLATEIGHKAAEFLTDSFQEGMKLSRMTLGVNFLAATPARGAEWMKEIRSLSAQSGYKMEELGGGLRLLAGNSDDLDNAIPRLKAVAKIGAGIGLDAENIRMFALAIGQVTAAGRFEAQELNQLTEHGLPIKELAKTAGLSVGEFRQQVKDGAVSIDILDKTLNRLALDPSGRYFDILNQRAGTALGQIDKLNSEFNLLKATIGVGIMEGLKDSGFLNALQNGLGWITQHGPEIKQEIDSILDAIRRFSVFTAAGLGVLADAWAENFDAMTVPVKNFLVVIAAVSRGQEELAKVFMLRGQMKIYRDIREAAESGVNMIEGLRLETGRNRGRDWGAAVGQSFAKPFAAAIQEGLSQIELFPHLSAEAAKLQSELRSSIKAGLSPIEKFDNSMKLLNEIKAFEQNRPLREMQLEAKNAGVGDFGFGGLEGAFGILINRAKVQNEGDIGIYQAFMDLEKSLGTAISQFPKAAERGTSEAESIITHAMGSKSYQERVFAVQEAQRRALEEMKKDIAGIARAVENSGVARINW